VSTTASPTTTNNAAAQVGTRSQAPPHPRRWIALAVIAVAQLMVVLDATIVNIALPQAQAHLGISDANRQWVVTAYTLTFGGLLLLGGRIADYWGRKRTFAVGMVGFAVASALGGLAQNGETLFAARALQGAFGALLAPASLALLTVLFTDARERAKAFGVYGAIAAGGASIGLLLGGVLTEYLDWRWCLLVNIPIAVIGLLAAIPLVPESKAHGNTKYDVPGALTVTLGLVSLVYGFTKAAEDGWSAAGTVGFIAAGVALIGLFVLIELRSKNPLLPMRIILDRNRGGSFLTALLLGAGMFGFFLFLIYYFQVVLGYSPLKAGVALLPMSAAVLFAAGLASSLVTRVGPKVLMAAGGLIATVAMLYLTRIGVDTGFASHVLPSEIALGLGLGLIFVPMSNLALVGVPEHDAGAASATLNATQQVGASLGTALLNTIYANAVVAYMTSHAPGAQAQLQGLVHGYTRAFWWAGAILLVGAVASAVLVKARRDEVAATGGMPIA
jgi:EmrB/QacA subfamily drug resistance transporter